ncbi:MAG TPA: hypothetical protein VD913_05370, partial [bacterium]|nr:hypothetical protein [bacterium]
LPKHQIFFNLVLISHCLAYLGALDNFLIMADIRIFPLYPFGLYLAVPYVTIVGIIFTFKKKIHFNREVDSA